MPSHFEIAAIALLAINIVATLYYKRKQEEDEQEDEQEENYAAPSKRPRG
jgi:hypothetical protein